MITLLVNLYYFWYSHLQKDINVERLAEYYTGYDVSERKKKRTLQGNRYGELYNLHSSPVIVRKVTLRREPRELSRYCDVLQAGRP